ncbi:tRNA 2'-phosphotransferase 1 [Haplosporangium sp. Z 11]|nr:tRNA 2'-phosphotransferase 1 [Haplosporangium sp. Z 11]
MSAPSGQSPRASSSSERNNSNTNSNNRNNRSNSTKNSSSSSSNDRSRVPRGDSPTVRLSKALSWLLRHNAEAQGITIRADGYVKIKDVLSHPKFKGYTLVDILTVVDTNDKKRFQILEDDHGNKEYIRAVQGHSMSKIADLGYEEITDATQVPLVVHGTMFSKWPLINGIKFYRTSNNVILSDGKDGDGIIPPLYFSQVIKSTGEVVFPKPAAP